MITLFLASVPTSAVLISPPSWDKLEEALPSASRPRPVHFDSVLDRSTPTFSNSVPTLFRERHGWCPYSERVWLALELKGVAYHTVTIDNTGGRPSYFAGSTPQMRWADGRTQGESNDLVKALDEAFPDTPPLWPPDGIPSSEVSYMVSEWKRTMPLARPSSRAAFLFDYDGDPLPRTTFEKALGRADELLGTHSAGPFFCGATVSAADVAWAPFLERWAAQLPCLHDGLVPRDASLFPRLSACFAAMDSVPAYACRVRGDAASWRKVLCMAGYGNGGVPPRVLVRMEDAAAASWNAPDVSEATWQAYATGRPHVAESAAAEAEVTMLRNRQAVLQDAARRAGLGDREELDPALRILVGLLAREGSAGEEDVRVARQMPTVGRLAAFLAQRLCVPRDMGAPAAAALQRLADALAT